MSAEDGIRRTLASYCQLFDSKKWDELARIFAEDASLTSRRGTFKGREAVIHDLQHAMTDDYSGTLFTSNSVIEVDGDTACVVSDFLGVEGKKIVAVGTYKDTLQRSGSTWRFTGKEIILK